MTQENAKKFKEYLLEKVGHWCAAAKWSESKMIEPLAQTTAARAEAYKFVLAKFEELSKESAPTESLHEMAKRMCFGRLCAECPANGIGGDCSISLFAEDAVNEAQIDFLRAWAAENPPKPKKTYLDDYLEKFPHAAFDAKDSPIGCPSFVYHGNDRCMGICRSTNCAECWSKPLDYWEAE